MRTKVALTRLELRLPAWADPAAAHVSLDGAATPITRRDEVYLVRRPSRDEPIRSLPTLESTVVQVVAGPLAAGVEVVLDVPLEETTHAVNIWRAAGRGRADRSVQTALDTIRPRSSMRRRS